MSPALSSALTNRNVQLALAGALAVMLIAAGVFVMRRFRKTPAERERLRRLAVHASGRIADAMVVDFQDGILYFNYMLGGMEYHAAQDISFLGEQTPEDMELIGSVHIKYLVNNPANSIVLCEEWSGLRTVKPRPQTASPN